MSRKLYTCTVPFVFDDVGRTEWFFGLFKTTGPDFLLNRVNGFGGEIKTGETRVSAHLRELKEESGIIAKPGQLFARTELDFTNGGAIVDFRLLMLNDGQAHKLSEAARERVETPEGVITKFNLGTLYRQRETMFAPHLSWIIPCMLARAPGGLVIRDGEDR